MFLRREAEDVTAGPRLQLHPPTCSLALPRVAYGRMPRTQHPAAQAPAPTPPPLASHHLIIPLLLINIHRLWALELLLSCCLLFAHSLEYSAHTLHRLHGLLVAYSHRPTVCYRSSCFSGFEVMKVFFFYSLLFNFKKYT